MIESLFCNFHRTIQLIQEHGKQINCKAIYDQFDNARI